MYCFNLHPFISGSIQSSNSRSHVRRWRWPLFDFLITCWVLSKWSLQKATGLWNLSVFRRWFSTIQRFGFQSLFSLSTVKLPPPFRCRETPSYFRVSEVTFLIFASWLKTSRLLGEIGKKKYDIMNDENGQRVFIFMHTYIHSFEKKTKKGEFNFFSAISEVGEWNDLLLKSHLVFPIAI